jgi:hypothetical protein
VKGRQTRRFNLVQIGYTYLEEVRRRIGLDNVPEGQWINAFRQAFPQHDGMGPIGIADNSWVCPDVCSAFPFVSTGGLDFYWAVCALNDCWRWLVEVN